MQGCNIRFNEDKLLTPESDIMTWIEKKYNNRKEVSKTAKNCTDSRKKRTE